MSIYIFKLDLQYILINSQCYDRIDMCHLVQAVDRHMQPHVNETNSISTSTCYQAFFAGKTIYHCFFHVQKTIKTKVQCKLLEVFQALVTSVIHHSSTSANKKNERSLTTWSMSLQDKRNKSIAQTFGCSLSLAKLFLVIGSTRILWPYLTRTPVCQQAHIYWNPFDVKMIEVWPHAGVPWL